MSATTTGADVRGFYAALGVELPGWANSDAPVRCFADPDAHRHWDRDPSCSVNLASGAFNCHGCGAHGGAYDAALATGLSPREAIDLMISHGLAERRPSPHTPGKRAAGHIRPGARATPRATAAPDDAERQLTFTVTGVQIGKWARALSENDALLEQLRAERGWDERVLRELQVGFDGRRITVRIPDEHGAVQGLLRLRVDGRQRPKVRSAPGTRLGLIPRPAPDQEHVWLVEGPSDMLAARSAGLPAIAVPGTDAWRGEWADALAGRRVTVVMDADRAGRKAALRIACDLDQHSPAGLRILDLAPERDDGYDLSDWLRDRDHQPTRGARAYTTGEFRRMLDSAGCTRAAFAGLSVVRGAAAASSAAAAIRRGGGRSYGCARF